MSVTGERLAEAMKLRGVEQDDVAMAIGATQGSISRIVVGQTRNSRLLPRIATYLGVTVPWLLGESDNPDGDLPENVSLDLETREMLKQFSGLAPADRKALLHIAKSMAGGPTPSTTVHQPSQGYRGED